MSGPKLYARLPDGVLVARQTYKKYTHVVAIRRPGTNWCAYRWTSVPEKALKEAQRDVSSCTPILCPVLP